MLSYNKKSLDWDQTLIYWLTQMLCRNKPFLMMTKDWLREFFEWEYRNVLHPEVCTRKLLKNFLPSSSNLLFIYEFMHGESCFVAAEGPTGIELAMPLFWVSHNGSKQSLIFGPSLVQHSYPNIFWSVPAFCNIKCAKKL